MIMKSIPEDKRDALTSIEAAGMTPFEVEASAARDVAAVEDVAAGVDVAGVEDVAVGVVVVVGADVPTTLENATGERYRRSLLLRYHRPQTLQAFLYKISFQILLIFFH